MFEFELGSELQSQLALWQLIWVVSEVNAKTALKLLWLFEQVRRKVISPQIVARTHKM